MMEVVFIYSFFLLFIWIVVVNLFVRHTEWMLDVEKIERYLYKCFKRVSFVTIALVLVFPYVSIKQDGDTQYFAACCTIWLWDTGELAEMDWKNGEKRKWNQLDTLDLPANWLRAKSLSWASFKNLFCWRMCFTNTHTHTHTHSHTHTQTHIHTHTSENGHAHKVGETLFGGTNSPLLVTLNS